MAIMNIRRGLRKHLLAGALVPSFLFVSHAIAFEAPSIQILLPEQVAAIADTFTSANTNKEYRELLDSRAEAMINTLKGGKDIALTQKSIDDAVQNPPLENAEWLKASGYDFKVKENQQAGIKILAPFWPLPRWQLQRSENTVTIVNLSASPTQQEHAIIDADAIPYLYFLPEALGPKLGAAFLRAYEKGDIGKAAALIKSTEIKTGAAKAHFNYPRPFLIDNNNIRLVADNYVAKDGAPYSASEGSYPSGHTNTGNTDSLLLAQMLPERFLPLVARGAGYGYSRLVLGVHYPLDVIGSRMVSQRNVAHFLNDPDYKKLFDEARDELRAALEKECGTTIAECAKPQGNDADPWTAPEARQFFNFTLTYGLPPSGLTTAEMQVPEGAEALLDALVPNVSPEKRREALKNTALSSGYPLDSQDPETGFWQRINLYEAALAAQQ
ncbi:acid phosphatase [Pseudochelatococcus contaminans]|uniref:acid phosphatase n=1 Tax=Pseudochelatococcus contaminans TaxID=1538103 RepID=A0A7W5Z6C6_9HYPH|nr:phosphatase PAP2 family protein [Pseudochelatococcus contaminans]MBB3810519.1 membrane-associated phospholipid phosphatase [Pseudochelatococcus contaminans]